MKTKIFLAALAFGGIATSAAAQEADGDYVQFNIGSGFVGNVDITAFAGSTPASRGDTDMDAGLFVSIAAGTNVGSYPLRIEGEFVATENDLDVAGLAAGVSDVKHSSQTVFLNAIYDFNVGGFTPYVGGGFGYGRVGYEVDGPLIAANEQNDKGFAWQVKAGVTFPVSDRMTLDIGYRYLKTADFDQPAAAFGIEAESGAHVVSIGARFGF